MEKKEKWHGSHHYSNKVHLLLIAFLFFGAITIYGAYFEIYKAEQKVSSKIPSITPLPSQALTPSPTVPTSTPSPAPKEGVFCTLDVKQCPDGSYVPRRGPNCVFVCPTPTGSVAP